MVSLLPYLTLKLNRLKKDNFYEEVSSLEEFLEITKTYKSGDLFVTPSFGHKKTNILSNPYIKFSAFEKINGEITKTLRFRENYKLFDKSSCEDFEESRFRILPTLTEKIAIINDQLLGSNIDCKIHGKNLSLLFDSKKYYEFDEAIDIINNFAYGNLKPF